MAEHVSPSSAKTVLVTGVSGFVGSAVAAAAARRGWAVRGLVRGGSSSINVANFGGELLEGDLRDPIAVERAMRGVDHLFHVAADYRIWAPDPEEIVRNNERMTRTVMEAALMHGIKRIVYTSSVATLLPDLAGAADETRPAMPATAIGAYKRSKVIAERLVEAMIVQHGLPAVIVNPSTPLGPRDAKPTPTGRIVVEAGNGRMPAFVASGLNLVHVDDVAEGHMLALERGAIGERYILGGEDVALADMLAEVARLTGRRPPRIKLPRTPLLPLAWLNEQRARLTGSDPFLTLDGLRMARNRMFYSSAKARDVLGYRARPWQAAIADAVDWFRGQDMIR